MQKLNKYGHMKVQKYIKKKKKYDEHTKALILKKEGRKIAMFQNNKL